ncbi:MAG: AI-2E family transporter, partial [Clostridia bacterium]|nr:AI-2E family transporter [Clostridia bacterium]
MKLDFNKKNTTIAVYAFIVIACSILFYTLVNNMAGVGRYIRLFFSLIAPFIYAFCIAYLLNPLMKQCDKWFKFVEKKKPNPKLKRGLSVLTTFIICLVVIGAFGWIVSHQIAESIVLFSHRVRVWIPEVGAWITNFIKKYNFFADFELQITNALSQLGNIALKFSETSLPVLWGGIKNITTGITNFVLAIIISIYMLYDKEKFINGIKKVLGVILKEKKKDVVVNIFADVNRIFSKFIIGKIIDSLIIGVVCTIGMVIFRMPFPPLVGFIVGVTNIIPYFGPFIGAGIG